MKFIISFILMFSSLIQAKIAPVQPKQSQLLNKIAANQESPIRNVQELKILQNKESVPYFYKVVDGSKKFLFLNFLSVTCDDSTHELMNKIKIKASQNVDVRLIVNMAFSYVSLSCLKDLENAGVKIFKTKTHSSYILNDNDQLLIGSQSIARMFFLADGSNHLDRDMMMYMEGNIARDGARDFLSIWSQHNLDDIAKFTFASEEEKNLLLPQCLWIADRPFLGVEGFKNFYNDAILRANSKIILSGVKINLGPESKLLEVLKYKNKENVSIAYIGNGLSSGNGELTMVLNEWGQKIWAGAKSSLNRLNQWDQQRVYKSNVESYQFLKKNLSIDIYQYFDFVHYKVALVDDIFLIGSANIDQDKNGKIFEAGVVCASDDNITNLNKILSDDISKSTPFTFVGEK